MGMTEENKPTFGCTEKKSVKWDEKQSGFSRCNHDSLFCPTWLKCNISIGSPVFLGFWYHKSWTDRLTRTLWVTHRVCSEAHRHTAVMTCDLPVMVGAKNRWSQPIISSHSCFSCETSVQIDYKLHCGDWSSESSLRTPNVSFNRQKTRKYSGFSIYSIWMSLLE